MELAAAMMPDSITMPMSEHVTCVAAYLRSMRDRVDNVLLLDIRAQAAHIEDVLVRLSARREAGND